MTMPTKKQFFSSNKSAMILALSLFCLISPVSGQSDDKNSGACQQVNGLPSDLFKTTWPLHIETQIGLDIDTTSLVGDDFAVGYCYRGTPHFMTSIPENAKFLEEDETEDLIGYYYECSNTTAAKSAQCQCTAFINGQKCASCSVCDPNKMPSTGNFEADCSNVENVTQTCTIDCEETPTSTSCVFDYNDSTSGGAAVGPGVLQLLVATAAASTIAVLSSLF